MDADNLTDTELDRLLAQRDPLTPGALDRDEVTLALTTLKQTITAETQPAPRAQRTPDRQRRHRKHARIALAFTVAGTLPVAVSLTGLGLSVSGSDPVPGRASGCFRGTRSPRAAPPATEGSWCGAFPKKDRPTFELQNTPAADFANRTVYPQRAIVGSITALSRGGTQPYHGLPPVLASSGAAR